VFFIGKEKRAGNPAALSGSAVQEIIEEDMAKDELHNPRDFSGPLNS
jgi:hypothetical protein